MSFAIGLGGHRGRAGVPDLCRLQGLEHPVQQRHRRHHHRADQRHGPVRRPDRELRQQLHLLRRQLLHPVLRGRHAGQAVRRPAAPPGRSARPWWTSAAPSSPWWATSPWPPSWSTAASPPSSSASSCCPWPSPSSEETRTPWYMWPAITIVPIIGPELMTPGGLQSHNIIPTQILGTDLMAAPVMGTVFTVAYFRHLRRLLRLGAQAGPEGGVEARLPAPCG